ncbi:uncharacterized protein F4812DRAFT_467328 [Daldinia caldariorum]|uniref:uncharacterized protein n=1 Tax=Daldinia caldariorum TaxID=326644 RepID=UPI002007599E|nr:uncharacterized protein F4812DRAFT_467328 [Daldinia caldariorum]KAI1471119.1 hypothetical protein F4812DRAFT_467328 [Daldinia caldariorum]
MEETKVMIVGAGPSGLALALSLAKLNSVILEKEAEITQDPRGVYLTSDAVRILWNLGLGDSLEEIGHELSTVNYHRASLVNDPFWTMDIGNDEFWQVLPNAILHTQPKLESAMRGKVIESSFCNLRCQCEVVNLLQEGDRAVIEYADKNGVRHKISGSFVVGADGKKGIVRKEFLEESAGIKQVEGSYRYDGTWIAANLKLKVPTSETHPNFPLWDLGFNPDAVYDLFWPKGWHFCSPPGRATAAGRFGPHADRLWRHEIEYNDWDDSTDAEKLLWENLEPMITRTKDTSNKIFPGGAVTYPRDCISFIRCRPYLFTHKVVNKWYHGRVVLIGDAAHVFPPFGGQGIACGFRDAHQLAWRIALLQRLPNSNGSLCGRLLDGWVRERRYGVDDATKITRMNGRLCNKGDDIYFRLIRTAVWLLRSISTIFSLPDPLAASETQGYQPVDGGFLLKKFHGGNRMAQIYVESSHGSPILSDELIRDTKTVMTLLIITRGQYRAAVEEVQEVLRAVDINPSVLSEDSLRVFSPDTPSETDGMEVYFPASTSRLAELSISIKPGYSQSNYLRRLGHDVKFVIIRPDLYTFALTKNTEELTDTLQLSIGVCIKKASKQFIIDTVNTIANGDATKTNAFISDCGYDFELEDLKDHKLNVDPSNGRIYIDGAMTHNTTEPDGKILGFSEGKERGATVKSDAPSAWRARLSTLPVLNTGQRALIIQFRACDPILSRQSSDRLIATWRAFMDKHSQEAQNGRAQATDKEKAKQDLVDQLNVEDDVAKKAELEQKIEDLVIETEKLKPEVKAKEEKAKGGKEGRGRELEKTDEARKKAREKEKRGAHAEYV